MGISAASLMWPLAMLSRLRCCPVSELLLGEGKESIWELREVGSWLARGGESNVGELSKLPKESGIKLLALRPAIGGLLVELRVGA